jgi:SAM-dependent methyltransferase
VGLRRYGQVFDQVAKAYDEARPGYPQALVDLALERGGLVSGARVLEVGCGTGKLTELLVTRGLHVDAVDPGENMIAAARRRVGPSDAVTFHLGRFEDIALPEGAFDAVFSATAFHWVDPAVGWAKAARHLRPGGLLALLVYLHIRDDRSSGFEEDLRAVVERHAPELAAEWRPPHELDDLLARARERRGNASEVWDFLMGEGRHGLAVPEAAVLYDGVEVASRLETVERTADEMIARLRTTSFYFRLDPARREAFEEDDRRVIERHGGTIRGSLATVLMTARHVI